MEAAGMRRHLYCTVLQAYKDSLLESMAEKDFLSTCVVVVQNSKDLKEPTLSNLCSTIAITVALVFSSPSQFTNFVMSHDICQGRSKFECGDTRIPLSSMEKEGTYVKRRTASQERGQARSWFSQSLIYGRTNHSINWKLLLWGVHWARSKNHLEQIPF